MVEVGAVHLIDMRARVQFQEILLSLATRLMTAINRREQRFRSTSGAINTSWLCKMRPQTLRTPRNPVAVKVQVQKETKSCQQSPWKKLPSRLPTPLRAHSRVRVQNLPCAAKCNQAGTKTGDSKKHNFKGEVAAALLRISMFPISKKWLQPIKSLPYARSMKLTSCLIIKSQVFLTTKLCQTQCENLTKMSLQVHRLTTNYKSKPTKNIIIELL